MAKTIPLPGLIPASFRGIGFFMPDTSSEVGRRVAAHHFPGVDFSAYDDHGLHPENISVEGFYVGSDYIARGRLLKQAFEIAGPATLMHPWWGVINVILTEPAEISFSANELRVVRFSANFERVIDQSQIGLSSQSTGPQLLLAGLVLAQNALSIIESINSNTVSRLRTDATSRIASQYLSFWNNIGGTIGSSIRSILPEILPSTPNGLSHMFTQTSRDLVDGTLDPVSLSAVAHGVDAKIDTPITTIDSALNLILNASIAMIDQMPDAPSQIDKALQAACVADYMGKAAELIVDIEPASRADALNLRATISNTLESFSNNLQSLFETVYSGDASSLNRATRTLSVCIIADINETIGRLPQTTMITLDRDVDAWAMAHMIYGDDLKLVEAGYLDLIDRNKIRHPANIDSQTLEILQGV